jgi:hypothetical protein
MGRTWPRCAARMVATRALLAWYLCAVALSHRFPGRFDYANATGIVAIEDLWVADTAECWSPFIVQ